MKNKCNKCDEDGLVRYPGRIGVFPCDCQNRRCIYCGCTESKAELSAPPEDICPLNPGCEYEKD
jgi:hypothetical protein